MINHVERLSCLTWRFEWSSWHWQGVVWSRCSGAAGSDTEESLPAGQACCSETAEGRSCNVSSARWALCSKTWGETLVSQICTVVYMYVTWHGNTWAVCWIYVRQLLLFHCTSHRSTLSPPSAKYKHHFYLKYICTSATSKSNYIGLENKLFVLLNRVHKIIKSII